MVKEKNNTRLEDETDQDHQSKTSACYEEVDIVSHYAPA